MLGVAVFSFLDTIDGLVVEASARGRFYLLKKMKFFTV
jgi:hypothetical protein